MRVIFITYLIFSCTILLYFDCYLVKAQKTNSEKYTSEKLFKLNQLREKTANILLKPYMKTDGYLIRWLKAKSWNLDSANDGLKQAMKWRQENNLNNILNEAPPVDFVRRPFYSLDTVDKEGRPVAIVDYKKIDTRKFATSGQTKQYVRAWTRFHEDIEDKIYKNANSTGKDITQSIFLVDMQYYTVRQHSCFACLPPTFESLRIYERYYPALFDKLIVINAPRIYLPFIDLLKPIMSPTTRDVLTVYGLDKTQWQPKLLQYIHADQLPSRMGGTKGKP